jgi:hypothetical protein
MAQVYSQAAYVVVWLGNDKRYQEAAAELKRDVDESLINFEVLTRNIAWEQPQAIFTGNLERTADMEFSRSSIARHRDRLRSCLRRCP